MYNGRVFASTFAGESCTFGQGSAIAGWKSQFIQQLTGANAVYFVPSFFIDPSAFNTYNGVIDGMFNVSFLDLRAGNGSLISSVELWLAHPSHHVLYYFNC